MSNNTPLFNYKDMNKIDKIKYIKILKKMCGDDQKMRKDFRGGKINWDKNIDKKNSEVLKNIILEIGWPSTKKIGARNERIAWLVVQHSQDNIFQKRCLKLMKQENGNKKYIAFLNDRIRVSNNKKQLYGTQFYLDSNGNLVPRPIHNIKGLESRRKKVGLNSFQKYSAKLKKSFRGNNLNKK